MSDLPEKLVDRVELEGWDAPRVEQGLARLHRAGRRRRIARAGAGLTAGGLAIACVAVLALPATRSAQGAAQDEGVTAETPVPATPGELRFADGSRAIPVGRDASLEHVLATDSEVRVRLTRGAGAFEVTPGVERRFVVEVGSLQVIVLGTAFAVERHGDEAHINVTRGLVRVRWPSGEAMLPAGAEGTFPCAPLASDVSTAAAPDVSDESAGAASADPAPTETPPADGAPVPSTTHVGAAPAPAGTVSAGSPVTPDAWRAHARAGDHATAYEALRVSGGGHVRDDVEDLMLAADVARLSGHGAEAIGYLTRVWRDHPAHPQAPLASFTAGRMWLSQGQPAEAARAFARARAQAPGGSLAQDALAREVEAWHRAGDAARAHALALEYQARFPAGRRLSAVRRFGGLP
uniref:ZK84.1 n=1 Tax=uncultured bacterium A1Q1_fos_91 TaxID=1256591 RepID=L7VZ89_9BACT|nr:ZK84.1 [uncultured bacterium A1Q1_fos_91]